MPYPFLAPIGVLLGCLLVAPLVAQEPAPDPVPKEPTPPGVVEGERLVITATRRAEAAFEVPYSTASVDGEQIRERQYRSTPQALRDVPGVFVQETSPGQGSPYIRGFTGFRNLFLIDGVRLNNSVFREGPNQYWNTVDPLSLDRLEVVKGPSSVLYGSDAIGGTVQAFTKDPYVEAVTAGVAAGGSSYVRYATAEDALWGRGEIAAGWKHADGSHTGALIGGTVKKLGDISAGDPTDEQPNTGYDEWDGDLKIVHTFDSRFRLVGAYQNVRQEDVPRTHSTVFARSFAGTSVGSDLRRDLNQRRWLAYLQLHGEDLGGTIDGMHLNASWHHQSELENRIRGNGDQRFQSIDVDTLGLWASFQSNSDVGLLTYGVEWYHDDVGSSFERALGPQPGDEIQGPVADDATYDTIAVYLQDELRVTERFSVLLGGRFNYARADANSVRDPVTGNQTSITDDWSDPVFSARARYELVEDELAAFGGVSQGFRAPNLSDLTRFDSARSNEFEVPAPNLGAENFLNYELGLKGDHESLAFEGAVFYTDIDDQIQRFPTGAVTPDGDIVISKANVGDGYVWGFDLGAAWRVIESTTLFASAAWNDSRIDSYEAAGGPPTVDYLSRVMPFMGRIGVRWDDVARGKLWAETDVVYAADADRLSLADQGDTQRIPPGGTPSWTVWNVRAGWHVSESATVFAALDNVLDEDYRVHGSGSNMPGRNLVLAVQASF